MLFRIHQIGRAENKVHLKAMLTAFTYQETTLVPNKLYQSFKWDELVPYIRNPLMDFLRGGSHLSYTLWRHIAGKLNETRRRTIAGLRKKI